MKKYKLVTTVALFFFLSYGFGKKNKMRCKDDVLNTTLGQFVWKAPPDIESAGYAISENEICWNEIENEPVLRQCVPGLNKWLPENVTCSIPAQKNVFCPENLIEIGLRDKNKFVCIKLSEQPHNFDANFCEGSDTLPIPQQLEAIEIKYIDKFLREMNITRFWLPVRKTFYDQYKPFVVQLPGEDWGEVFDVQQSLEDMLSDKLCLTGSLDTNLSTIPSEMTHCNDVWHSICIFRKHFVTVSGCPQGFGAMSDRPNECYGVEWKAGLFPHDLRAIPLEEYFEKRNTIQMIFEEREDESERFFLVNIFSDYIGNQYAIEMNTKEKFRIVPFEENTPALSSEIVSNRKNVKLILKMDTEMKDLILIVYNRNYIWRLDDDDHYGIKCFTDAEYELHSSVKIKKIWENDWTTKTIFELKLSNDHPGYYWCEAHTIFNFSLVTSQKVVARKRQKGHTFAMHLNVSCRLRECHNIFGKIKALSRRMKKTMNDCKNNSHQRRQFSELNIHDVVIVEIESVDIEQSIMRCLCHVSVSLKSSAVDNSYEQNSDEIDSEENDYGIRYDTSIRMHLRYLLSSLLAELSPNEKIEVRSTEFCFPEDFREAKVGGDNYWNSATYGQSATTNKLCLQKNGLPITRKCEGSFKEGAYWENISTAEMYCIIDVQQSIITKNLYDLDITKASKKTPYTAVKGIKNLLEDNINNLIPADFYYMSKIIPDTIKSLFVRSTNNNNNSAHIATTTAEWLSNKTVQTTSDIVRIFNYLMEVNECIIKPSIILNSTNILLDAFENLIDNIILTQIATRNNAPAMLNSVNKSVADASKGNIKYIDDSDKVVETVIYDDIGVVLKMATNFVIFIIDPSVANVSGIALFRKGEHKGSNEQDVEFENLGALRGAFEDVCYRFILANQVVDELLYETNLEMATFVPETLWKRLDEISRISNRTTTSQQKPDPKVVIKVYSNDKLFQEDGQIVDKAVEGNIISISIPGHDKDLPEMMPLILKVNSGWEENNTDRGCMYWNYKTWANDGLTLLARSKVDSNIIVCACTHLTPFAYLIGGNYNFSVDSDVIMTVQKHKKALDFITLLGCSLSLLGIVGIFITAITFQSWRQKASSKVLLQLSAAIALQMTLFCFINTEEMSQHFIENEIFSSCIAIGACLHYSVLVQFCWTLIIAYLQFKRYVQVFGNIRPKRFFIKSTLVGWGVPLIPVALVLIIDRKSYIPSINSEAEDFSAICYPTGYSLYIGIVLPITIVILANLIVFIIVIYSILRSSDGIRHTEKKLALSQMRLSILLFFLLGFTWIFGLLTTMKAGIIFSYLFSMTATLQGFVIFIYFIILDPITRRMWGGYFQRTLGIHVAANIDGSTSAKETTTQSF